MSENNADSSKKPADLSETNDDGDILTLSDLLNEQREIDEVICCCSIFKNTETNSDSHRCNIFRVCFA